MLFSGKTVWFLLRLLHEIRDLKTFFIALQKETNIIVHNVMLQIYIFVCVFFFFTLSNCFRVTSVNRFFSVPGVRSCLVKTKHFSPRSSCKRSERRSGFCDKYKWGKSLKPCLLLYIGRGTLCYALTLLRRDGVEFLNRLLCFNSVFASQLYSCLNWLLPPPFSLSHRDDSVLGMSLYQNPPNLQKIYTSWTNCSLLFYDWKYFQKKKKPGLSLWDEEWWRFLISSSSKWGRGCFTESDEIQVTHVFLSSY